MMDRVIPAIVTGNQSGINTLPIHQNRYRITERGKERRDFYPCPIIKKSDLGGA